MRLSTTITSANLLKKDHCFICDLLARGERKFPFSQKNEITGGASLIPETVTRRRDLGAERKGRDAEVQKNDRDVKQKEGEMREVGEAPL